MAHNLTAQITICNKINAQHLKTYPDVGGNE